MSYPPPPGPTPALAAAASRLVDLRTRDTEDASGIAQIGVGLVEQLCGRLANLVGDAGVAAVLDRAVKNVEPALGGASEPATAPVRRWGPQLETVRHRIGGLDPTRGRAACASVLTGFVAMVCTFIGEALTWRVLHDLWPDAFGPAGVADDEAT